jgi:hypothetical protein
MPTFLENLLGQLGQSPSSDQGVGGPGWVSDLQVMESPTIQALPSLHPLR